MSDSDFGIKVYQTGAEQAAGQVDDVAKSLAKVSEQAKSTTAGMTEATSATGALTEGMKMLKEAAIAVGAGWAAMKMYDYAKDAAMLNARYETLGVAMTAVGKNVGYSAIQMEAAAAGMQKMGISMNESRSAAMQLIQAHIDLSKANGLARVAQDAAVIGNINSSEAFGRLVHGIQSAQVEVLRTIGINVTFEDGYKRMADSLGKNVAQLTDNEKSQSRLNQVMEKGKDIFGVYEAAMGTAGKQMLSMQRYAEDLKVKQGELFNEVLTVGVMAYAGHLKDANGEMDRMATNGELTKRMQEIADTAAFIADSVSGAAAAFRLWGTNIAEVMAATEMRSLHPIVYWFQGGKEAIAKAAEEDRQEIMNSTHMFRDALDERRKAVAEKNAKEAAALKEESERISNVVQYYAGLREKQLMDEVTYVSTISAILVNAYNKSPNYADSGGIEKAIKDDPRRAILDEQLSALTDAAAREKSINDDRLKVQSEQHREGLISDKQYYDFEQTALMEASNIKVREYQKQLDILANFDNQTVKEEVETQKKINKVYSEQLEAYRAYGEASKLLGQKYAYDSDKPRRDAQDAAEKEIQAINDQTIATQRKIDTFGMLPAAITAATIATLEQNRADLEGTGLAEADIANINRKIEALQKLGVAQARETALEEGAKAAKKAADESAAAWKKASDEIERALTDSLMRGFESGKSFGQNFVDSLRNTLKTAALKVVVSAIVDPVMGTLQGAAGANGSGLFGNSTSLINSASAGGSLYNFATGNVGNGIYGAFAGSSVGQSLGLSYGSLMGPTTSGGALSGAALTTLGEVVPYIGAAIAAISVLGNLFGGGGGPKTGGSALVQNGVASPWSALGMVTEHQADTQFGDTLKTFQAGIDQTITKLGGHVDKAMSVAIGLSSDPAGDAPDFTFANVTSGAGKTLYSATNTNVGRGQGATELGTEMQRMLIAALQAADIPAWAREIVSAISPATASADQMTASMTALDAALTGINNANAARAQLLDSLMTDTQKLAAAHQALATAGIPETVAGFTAMASGLDLTTTAGQNTLAQMINLKGAFDLVQQSASNVSATSTEAAVKLRSVTDIMNEHNRLQDEYDNLTMTATQLIDKQRAALDSTNVSLFNSIQLIKEQQSAQAKIDEATASRTSLLESLLTPTQQLVAAQASLSAAGIPDTVAGFTSLAASLDLTTESGRSMLATMLKLKTGFDLVQSSAAAQKVKDDADAAAQKQKTDQLDALRSSWQNQLDILTGAKTQQQIDRAAQLASTMDATTLATIRLVHEQQDLKAAYEAATSAAKVAEQASIDASARADTARNALLSAYQREADIKKQLISTWNQYSASLLSYKQSLLTGNMSPLTPQQKYEQTLLTFNDISARAKLGDQTAIEQLQNVSQEFLNVSQMYNASSAQYATDFAKVQAALTTTASVADRQALIAQQELTTLTNQVSQLITINTSVLSVKDAITALASATSAAAAAALAASAAKAAVPANPAVVIPTTPTAPDTSSIAFATTRGITGYMSDSAMLKAAKVLYLSATGGISTAWYDKYVGAVGGPSKVEGWAGDPAALRAYWKFDVGTNYVPRDMTASIHQGERIIPAADNRELMGRLRDPAGGNLAAKMDALIAKIDQLAAGNQMQAEEVVKGQYGAIQAAVIEIRELTGLTGKVAEDARYQRNQIYEVSATKAKAA